MSWTCNGQTFPTFREANTVHQATRAPVEYVHEGASIIRLTPVVDVNRMILEAHNLSTKLSFPVQIVEVKHAR